ncbi:MAG: hypothetical protein A2167_05475 [Planctomycetes bacterium RBG_13_46_10]|nr:MAG: hypothetical protein A2167_05475 [Planctomycetes bacterium RBG_13_46_10]
MAGHTVKYENQTMIVTHPTGVVDKYSIEELNSIKTYPVQIMVRLTNEIQKLDDHIVNCQTSVGSG